MVPTCDVNNRKINQDDKKEDEKQQTEDVKVYA